MIEIIEEITFEITDYCPNSCKFCSSNTTNKKEEASFLTTEQIEKYLRNKKFNHIIISGGEPLSHPKLWDIIQLCKKHSDDIILYTNTITHLIYNPHVIDGVYLEANLTVTPETDKIHILRRVKQGREKNRPEVHLSENFKKECSCAHRVIRPDGRVYRTPCDKYFRVEETNGD